MSSRYAERMDLNACTPRPDLCTSTYCLAAPGREYLCFFPAGSSEGLDLWDAPGAFAAEWFDPATGEATPGGEVAGGGRAALSAPFAGPSVLYLRRTD